MNDYRQKLKTQNILFALGVAALAAVQLLALFRVLRPIAADSRWIDRWNGFVAGAAFGVMALFVAGIVINLRALCDEERLKKLFVKENDERAALIALKGKSAGATACLCALPVAAIVSGYFSVAVSATVIGCLFLLSLCMAGGKLYYSKKL